jgi:hypothetical protein
MKHRGRSDTRDSLTEHTPPHKELTEVPALLPSAEIAPLEEVRMNTDGSPSLDADERALFDFINSVANSPAEFPSVIPINPTGLSAGTNVVTLEDQSHELVPPLTMNDQDSTDVLNGSGLDGLDLDLFLQYPDLFNVDGVDRIEVGQDIQMDTLNGVGAAGMQLEAAFDYSQLDSKPSSAEESMYHADAIT